MSVTIDGSAGVTTNSGAVYDGLQRGTSVTASGTSVDFNIPSWAKRITVMFSGVSSSGTSAYILQLGTGSTPTFVNTGYTSIGVSFGASSASSTARTTGLAFADSVNASYTFGGNGYINNVTGNTWSFNSALASGTTTTNGSCIGAGSIALSAALTAIRITTVNGTDTFDAGTINVMWE